MAYCVLSKDGDFFAVLPIEGGVVAYSNRIKENILSVNKSNIDTYGAVSEEVVEQMAEGVRKLYNTDFAIATSGIYERGAHIHDPLNGLIAIGAKSATVVGVAGWLCDAMATAVVVGGVDSAKWFGQPGLKEYKVFGVYRHEDLAWEI